MEALLGLASGDRRDVRALGTRRFACGTLRINALSVCLPLAALSSVSRTAIAIGSSTTVTIGHTAAIAIGSATTVTIGHTAAIAIGSTTTVTIGHTAAIA